MIPIDDPANLGPTLGHYRVMLGLSLRNVARGVANRTGRHEDHVRAQICAWETGRTVPGMVAVKPYLAELRLGVALVPLDDDGPKAAPESTESAEQAPGVDRSREGDSRALATRSGGEAKTWECKLTRQHNPATKPCDCRVSQFCAMGRSLDEPNPRFWGEHPAHPTCIDVTGIDQTPRSAWICGPECPKEA